MKKKLSVSIGIPAYNEEANIGNLLKDLKAFADDSYILEKIIVYSDASTDKTVQVVKSIKWHCVELIEAKSRVGSAITQNSIFSRANSDIVILLDADVRIKDKKFISKLIRPVVEKRVDLVSCRITPLKNTAFIGKALEVSTKFKFHLYESLAQGKNIYTCHGAVRAFSKKFYKSFTFPPTIGEDAFSYLQCITTGFKYGYVKNTEVLYQLPQNLRDHARQSVRYLQSRKSLKKYFDPTLIDSEYKIPLSLTLHALTKSVLKNPLYMMSYIVIYTMMKIRSIFTDETSAKWNISKSSKLHLQSV